MDRKYVTAVPAFSSSEPGGPTYASTAHLITLDTADEPTGVVGLTVITGRIVPWNSMIIRLFQRAPRHPLDIGSDVSQQTAVSMLRWRWVEWLNEVRLEMECNGEATDDATVFKTITWGGVIAFEVDESSCHGCVKPRSIVPVMSSLCWPLGEWPNSTDTRTPWEVRMPAEHIRNEIKAWHDLTSDKFIELTNDAFQLAKDRGWRPNVFVDEYEGSDISSWTLNDLEENGWYDEITQFEEQASEEFEERSAQLHADSIYIPMRVATDWDRITQRMSRTRMHMHHRDATFIVWAYREGFNAWRAAIGR